MLHPQNQVVMKYLVSLEHDDFVLILDILKNAQLSNVINWDAAGMICEHTQLEPWHSSYLLHPKTLCFMFLVYVLLTALWALYSKLW